MSTKQCKLCGKRITEKSMVCPYCGEFQDKNTLIKETITFKKITIIRVVIFILAILTIYQTKQFLTKESSPKGADYSRDKVSETKINISCNAQNIEDTVKKLSIDVARAKINYLAKMDRARSSKYYETSNSLWNVEYVTLNSVYPTGINREINMITCRGDVNIYSKGYRYTIPMLIEYKVQFEENGLNGYVEIISADFRNKYFMYPSK